jgi:hypothetical protein
MATWAAVVGHGAGLNNAEQAAPHLGLQRFHSWQQAGTCRANALLDVLIHLVLIDSIMGNVDVQMALHGGSVLVPDPALSTRLLCSWQMRWALQRQVHIASRLLQEAAVS